MSTTYKVITGDTFESIARKKYGTELDANKITKANPGVNEPLTPGIEITIPIASQNIINGTDDNDEVIIIINGIRFRFWNSVRIIQSMDNISIVEFSAPFEPDIPNFREQFRPFSYVPISILVGGELFFTGTIMNVPPMLENTMRTIEVTAYAIPGVLNDCTVSASAYPIEFNEQGLQDIAKTLCEPFGIDVKFEDNQGAIFDPRVALDPDKKILSFLTELTKQRNLVMSNTDLGALLFQRSIETGKPVAILKQGSAPIINVQPFFSPQDYYSHITGLMPVIVGTNGSQFTVKNPHLKGVTRPLTFYITDTDVGDIKAVVDAKMGRMFGNMVSYSVEISTWRDPSGNLWKSNTTVKLIAPAAMIYNEYEFIIRSVTFNAESNNRTAILDLVIPESFSGKIPESLPWDE